METKTYNGSENICSLNVNIYIDKNSCKTKANTSGKMGKCYEYMIHRRTNINDQQTYERMLKFIC